MEDRFSLIDRLKNSWETLVMERPDGSYFVNSKNTLLRIHFRFYSFWQGKLFSPQLQTYGSTIAIHPCSQSQDEIEQALKDANRLFELGKRETSESPDISIELNFPEIYLNGERIKEGSFFFVDPVFYWPYYEVHLKGEISKLLPFKDLQLFYVADMEKSSSPMSFKVTLRTSRPSPPKFYTYSNHLAF